MTKKGEKDQKGAERQGDVFLSKSTDILRKNQNSRQKNKYETVCETLLLL